MRAIGIGAGGHAKAVLEALRARGGWEIVGLLDRDRALWGKEVLGVPVLGGDEMLRQIREEGISHAFLGVGSVGDAEPRRRLFDLVRGAGFEMARCVHPSALVSPSAVVGEGATIMAHAVVQAEARLGANVIVNTGAVVEHDCALGDHVHVASGAVLASTVVVGDGAHIGAGAAVRERVRIGAGAIVGAGAAVVSDVEEGSVVAGVPARPLKRRGS